MNGFELAILAVGGGSFILGMVVGFKLGWRAHWTQRRSSLWRTH